MKKDRDYRLALWSAIVGTALTAGTLGLTFWQVLREDHPVCAFEIVDRSTIESPIGLMGNMKAALGMRGNHARRTN